MKKLMRKKLALMLANLKKKRKYYCEVEYLEADGTQYIDTGYKMTAGHVPSFKGVIEWTQSNGIANFFYGYRSVNSATATGDMRTFFVYGQTSYGSTGRLAIRYGVNTDNSTSTISLNQRYTLSFDGTNLKVDGATFVWETASYTPANYQNMYLFWCNCTGYYSADVAKFSGRIYNWQIFEDGVLVRDFIPVLDWSYVPCMYDKVSGQLFYNQGTGTFQYGREIHYVEYLESTGEQYIDTGYIPNTNTECSMNLAFVSLDSTYRTPFSVRTADGAANSFTIMSSRETNDNNSFAFGSNYWTGPSVPKVVLNKTVEAVLRKGYASWDGVSGGPGTSITPTTLTAYMFARNANGTAGNFFMGKIYSCIIKDNNTLVRDFIPAIDSEGRGFMFDRVTHTIYDNAGTGAFKYPAREVEYLKTDGKNLIYINPALSYFPDFEVGIKCDANTDRNVTLGTDANNMFERFSATQPYWTLHASGSVFMSSVGVSTYVDAKYKDGVFSSNGNTVGTKANTFPRGTFYLFRAPTNENAYKMSVYFFKAWDNNGVLVRDFIPCYKDGVLGMWDKANSVFYSNAGTGKFTTSKIIEPEYE